MEKLAFYLSCLTVAALNVILFIVASSNDKLLDNSVSFNGLVNGMYGVLLSSSAIFSYLNWRAQQRLWALLFSANLLIVFISTLLSIASLVKLPTSYLIVLDLYWLNQYLIYMTKHARLV